MSHMLLLDPVSLRVKINAMLLQSYDVNDLTESIILDRINTGLVQLTILRRLV